MAHMCNSCQPISLQNKSSHFTTANHLSFSPRPASVPKLGKIQDDGKLNLVSLSDSAKRMGLPTDKSWDGRKLDSEPAEAFLKANMEFQQKNNGKNIKLESAYRDTAKNAAVGGSKTSNHPKGKAVDIAYADVDQAKAILERNGLKQLGGTWNGKDERNHFSVTGA